MKQTPTYSILLTTVDRAWFKRDLTLTYEPSLATEYATASEAEADIKRLVASGYFPAELEIVPFFTGPREKSPIFLDPQGNLL